MDIYSFFFLQNHFSSFSALTHKYCVCHIYIYIHLYKYICIHSTNTFGHPSSDITHMSHTKSPQRVKTMTILAKIDTHKTVERREEKKSESVIIKIQSAFQKKYWERTTFSHRFSKYLLHLQWNQQFISMYIVQCTHRASVFFSSLSPVWSYGVYFALAFHFDRYHIEMQSFFFTWYCIYVCEK